MNKEKVIRVIKNVPGALWLLVKIPFLLPWMIIKDIKEHEVPPKARKFGN